VLARGDAARVYWFAAASPENPIVRAYLAVLSYFKRPQLLKKVLNEWGEIDSCDHCIEEWQASLMGACTSVEGCAQQRRSHQQD